MPVRFQVDPDFYDHPKTAGMSDAAFSLWVRAGSFSAAKLTDGFIAETVLVHTLRSDTPVADELVERGLWRRRRGGYVFHEWTQRNLTRQRVRDTQQADAKRKREERKRGNGQVSGHVVQPDTERTPTGQPPESDPCCVGVGVVSSSGSVGGEGYLDVSRARENPPQRHRCTKHQHIPDTEPGPPCHGCQDVRLTADQQKRDEQAHKKAVVQSWRAVVDACSECDENGFIETPTGQARHHGKPLRSAS
jgi:hypothetical protein